MARFDSEGTSPFYKTYATISADVDLRADGPNGQPARWFRCAGAGDLVLFPPGSLVSVTIPAVAAGEVVVAGAATIDATTTATQITAFW